MNKLYYGDNLDILRKYISDNSIDLIYLDPPFNSKADYNIIFKEENGTRPISQIKAFSDFWHWDENAQKTYQELMNNPRIPEKLKKLLSSFENFLGHNDVFAYLVMISIRLVELHRVLKDTGSLYLHCDHTISHYIKLVLDAIFSPKNFRNEIIWHKKGGIKAVQKIFPRKYDSILFYTKTNKYTFYILRGAIENNALYNRWIKYSHDGKTVLYKDFPRTDKVKFAVYTKRFIAQHGREPRPNDVFYEFEGAIIDSVWDDIPDIYRGQRERLGYPTQKPLELLERIIKASSKEGDLVLDPFCGCGTTLDASEKLHRNWIGIDITHIAINVIKKRLKERYPNVQFEVIGEPKDLESAISLAQQDRFQFQLWALSLIGATPSEKMISDKGIDGIFYNVWLNKKYYGIVQVKSGHVGAKDIRDFKGTIRREKADYGIFITLQPPTRDMKEEAISEGYFNTEYEKDIPRIQIITIEDLLKGIEVKFPAPPNIYNVAQRGKKEDKNTKQIILSDLDEK